MLYLLEQGADPTIKSGQTEPKSNYNETAEEIARKNNHFAIADLLKDVTQAERGISGDAAMLARQRVLADFKMNQPAQEKMAEITKKIAQIAEELKEAALALNIEKIYELADQLIQMKEE